MDDHGGAESFEAFRTSFSYGSRNDLNFKFFKGMSDDQVASLLQDLLNSLGDAYDTGDVLPLIEAAYEAQVEGYSPPPNAPTSRNAFEDGPFTPNEKSIATSTVGLFTTSGHFVVGDDPMPFGETSLTQEDAVLRISEFLKDTPILSEIPSDTLTSDLRVRHGGYDIRSAVRDPNVTFPIDRLREMLANRDIRDVASTFFSFPGATAQGRLRRELQGWIERIHEQNIDVMLLVPV
ncbi:MAG: glycine/sarcosine/betaine reductase selenoprotein B family protein [Acidimicrobiia bacterium]